MKRCSTCCTDAKTYDLGISQTRPDEKLEFVEHVLGVLIESRFGMDNPYTRLGDQPVTTGHSQMFANVSLLTEAEIEVHLSMSAARPSFYLDPCLGRRRENHLRQRVVLSEGELILITESNAASGTPGQCEPC